MGFLSGAWKSVKKGFKSIGKGIKSAFKKFGKFMGKIGIFGQIAMMFILPGIGGALMKGIGSAFSGIVGQTAAQGAAAAASASATATAAATAAGATTAAATTAGATAAAGVSTAASGLLGSTSAIARGAGQVLQAAGNFVKVGHSAFKTVTEGITSFVGEMGKTALNKIPGVNISSAATDFSTAWGNVQTNIMENAGKTMDAFNTAIGYTPPTPAPVVSATPYTGSTATTPVKVGKVTDTYAGITQESLPLGSEGVTSLSTPLETAQASISQSETARGNFFDDLNAPRVGGPAPVVDKSFAQQVVSKPSLMEDPAGYIKDVYTKGVKQVSQGFEDFRADPTGTLFGEDPIGRGVETASGQVTGLLAQRGIMGKPPETNVYYGAVANIEPAAGMNQYGSPEINARAYEMEANLYNFQSQNSWGHNAYTAYQQTLAKAAGATTYG
tara:strand:- start:2985 stop:4313 length:1329 start_codon:yes stop_codon:yes gene_type:complete